MSKSLSFREFRPSDLKEVLRLWEHDSGWGPITARDWRQWFVDTPHGPAPVTVAINSNDELVAQCVGVPTRIVCDGTELRALRLSAPIVRSHFRDRTLLREDHPIVGLLSKELQLARDHGFSVVYALPRRSFLPFFRWIPNVGLPSFAELQIGCLEVPLGTFQELRCSSDDFVARVVSDFADDYSQLWANALRAFPIRCGIVRAHGYLGYKLGSHVVIEVRKRADQTLEGYLAIKPQAGLIVDILARSPDCLAGVLRSTMRFLGSKRDLVAKNRLEMIKAMDVPLLGTPLRNCGFRSAKFKFAFVCCSLDSSVAHDRIAPERWYLMPGD